MASTPLNGVHFGKTSRELILGILFRRVEGVSETLYLPSRDFVSTGYRPTRTAEKTIYLTRIYLFPNSPVVSHVVYLLDKLPFGTCLLEFPLGIPVRILEGFPNTHDLLSGHSIRVLDLKVRIATDRYYPTGVRLFPNSPVVSHVVYLLRKIRFTKLVLVATDYGPRIVSSPPFWFASSSSFQ
jgi:hypothetical protein